mgnify:CR=1 FL=1
MKRLLVFLSALVMFGMACMSASQITNATSEPYKRLHLPANVLVTPSAINTVPTPPMYRVIGNVNIRTARTIHSPAVGILYQGQTIKADCLPPNGWCKVDGGYVLAACLTGNGVCK